MSIFCRGLESEAEWFESQWGWPEFITAKPDLKLVRRRDGKVLRGRTIEYKLSEDPLVHEMRVVAYLLTQ